MTNAITMSTLDSFEQSARMVLISLDAGDDSCT